MDDLLEQFDDLELQGAAPSAQQLQLEKRKGKQPVGVDDVDDDASDSEDDGDAVGGAAASPPSPARTAASEPSELTCAICLGDIRLEEMAMVKGCDHIYCAKCILLWALHRDSSWCPQCKQPFSSLLTYRTLDGQLQDFPAEESVVLLKRARWFEDALREGGAGASALLDESRAADSNAWQEYADDFDLADDEAIEAFYFSSAAGRARVVVGNRRFGEGGYISTGRRHARPVPPPLAPKRGAKGKGGAAGPSGSASRAQEGGGDGYDDDDGCLGAGPSGSGSGGGRRGKKVRGGGGLGKAGRSGELAVVGTAAAAGGAVAGPSGSAAVPICTPNANGGRRAAAGSPGLAVDLFGCSPGSSGGAVHGTSPSASGTGRRARRSARRQAEVGCC